MDVPCKPLSDTIMAVQFYVSSAFRYSLNRLFLFPNQPELTEVPDIPHRVNGGVTFVENNEEWGSGDTLCQRLTVQILPGETKIINLNTRFTKAE